MRFVFSELDVPIGKDLVFIGKLAVPYEINKTYDVKKYDDPEFEVSNLRVVPANCYYRKDDYRILIREVFDNWGKYIENSSEFDNKTPLEISLQFIKDRIVPWMYSTHFYYNNDTKNLKYVVIEAIDTSFVNQSLNYTQRKENYEAFINH